MLKVKHLKTALYAPLLTLSLGFGGYQVSQSLLKPPFEAAFETRVGKPLNVLTSNLQERARYVDFLESICDHLDQNWDFFQLQLNNISSFTLPNNPADSWLFTPRSKDIRVSVGDSGALVHELAHAWTVSLSVDIQSKLENRLTELMLRSSPGCHNLYSAHQEHKTHTLPFPSDYASKNWYEHVAELVRLVYELNDPKYAFSFNRPLAPFRQAKSDRPLLLVCPHITQNALHLIPFVKLLQSYHFFSEREGNHAITCLTAASQEKY